MILVVNILYLLSLDKTSISLVEPATGCTRKRIRVLIFTMLNLSFRDLYYFPCSD